MTVIGSALQESNVTLADAIVNLLHGRTVAAPDSQHRGNTVTTSRLFPLSATFVIGRVGVEGILGEAHDHLIEVKSLKCVKVALGVAAYIISGDHGLGLLWVLKGRPCAMVAVRAPPVDSLAWIVKSTLSMNRKNPKLRSGISDFAALGRPTYDLSVNGGIFLLSGEQLVEMREQAYGLGNSTGRAGRAPLVRIAGGQGVNVGEESAGSVRDD
jgi:hypothetical protein